MLFLEYFNAFSNVSEKRLPTNFKSHAPPEKYLILDIFCEGVVVGINIVPFIFNLLHKYANPCAWFPALAHTTCVDFCKLIILENAPLILNDLTICWSSLFKYILQLYLFDNLSLNSNGVFLIIPVILLQTLLGGPFPQV